MQDRFKFRIFYADKMVYPNSYEDIESIYECLKQQVMWDCDIDTDLKFNHIKNNLVFMQCTGLKDKNGKLIFEGDIVKYFCPAEYCSDGLHKCPECYSGENGSVYYDEDLAMYEYRSKSDECPLTDNINTKEDLEIIGNIYETPELLKGNKNG